MSGSVRSKFLLAAAKAAGLAVFVFLLIQMVDWREFLLSLKSISPWTFALLVFLDLAAAFIMAGRWHLLIAATGRAVPLRSVISYTLLGMFFNQIMPGSITGDAARIWCLARHGVSWKSSAAIVVWDRTLGLMALVSLSLPLFPFFAGTVFGPELLWPVIVLLSGSLVLFLALQSGWFLTRAERAGTRLASRIGGEAGGNRAADLFRALRTFLAKRRLTAAAFALSLLIRFLWLVGALFVSSSLGLAVPGLFYLFFIPLVELLRLVPVSVQGLGLREVAFIFFLKPYGVSPAQAALLSMVFYTALTAAGLTSGLLYAVGPLRGRPSGCAG